MDKKNLFWLKHKAYLWWKQWGSVFLQTFVSSFWSWFTIFVAGSIVVFTALLIARSREDVVDLNNYFPPYIGWGLLIAFAGIYAYQLMVTIAEKLENYELEAMLFTWRDILFEKYYFKNGTGYSVGLKVISLKPPYAHPAGEYQEYEITFVPEIVHLNLNGESVYSRIKLPVLIMKGDIIFKKSQEVFNQRFLKRHKTFTVIPIAHHDGNHVWVTDAEQNHDKFLELDTRYYAQIEMRESRNFDDKMQGCAVTCEIRPYRNERSEISILIEVVERFPEFSPKIKYGWRNE